MEVMEKETKAKTLLEEIAEKKTIYHRKNYQYIRYDSSFRDIYNMIVQKQESLFCWFSQGNEYGEMKNELFIFENFAVLVQTWIPHPGYNWDEQKYILYKFK